MSEINNIKAPPQPSSSSVSKVSEGDKKQEQQSQNAPVAGAKSDSVSLTGEATQLQSIQQTLEETPIVNNDRVAALRAAIADGSYKVDATELAQNIIDFETQLL